MVIDLFREFLSTPKRYGPESGGIGKVMKLYFQPYKDLMKCTSYVVMASFLVQTVSGIREGNEVQVEDDSDFNVYVSNAAMSSSVALCPLCYACHKSVGCCCRSLNWYAGRPRFGLPVFSAVNCSQHFLVLSFGYVCCNSLGTS